MSKQEFLDRLRMALNGRIAPGQVTDNINYYSDYIDAQMRTGKSEEEVLKELGDPRLIAKTIIATSGGAEMYGQGYQDSSNGYYQDEYQKDAYQDTYQGGNYSGNYRNSYRDNNYQGSYRGNGQENGRHHGKVYQMPGWLLAVIIILVVVLVLGLAFSVLSFLMPVLLPIVVVLFLVKLFRDWLN